MMDSDSTSEGPQLSGREKLVDNFDKFLSGSEAGSARIVAASDFVLERSAVSALSDARRTVTDLRNYKEEGRKILPGAELEAESDLRVKEAELAIIGTRMHDRRAMLPGYTAEETGVRGHFGALLLHREDSGEANAGAGALSDIRNSVNKVLNRPAGA